MRRVRVCTCSVRQEEDPNGAVSIKGLLQFQMPSCAEGTPALDKGQWVAICNTNSTKEHGAYGKSYWECVCLESNTSNYISISLKYQKFHIYKSLSSPYTLEIIPGQQLAISNHFGFSKVLRQNVCLFLTYCTTTGLLHSTSKGMSEGKLYI